MSGHCFMVAAMTRPQIYALIVAGGAGARMGGEVPKQYLPLFGAPMIRHALKRFLVQPDIEGVMAVIRPDDLTLYEAAIAPLYESPATKEKLLPPIPGGLTRQDSVRYGLEALAPLAPDFVMIHDAARPFPSQALIGRVIHALDGRLGVIPALPVVDTIRSITGETLVRETLRRIQTPQAFPFARILALHQQAAENRATDDAALWLAAGEEITYVTGEERNRKMTHAEDTALTGLGVTKVGMGFDVHRLAIGDGVMLGGIRIPSTLKLEGHSDADVVLHAVVDALLGSIGAGDIGSHFPPSDPQWKGANSAQFVTHAAALLEAQGAQLVHLDITIICEVPKIAPHREAMRLRMASLLGVTPDQISVKATTTEALGFTGRGEGIAAQAVATVVMG